MTIEQVMRSVLVWSVSIDDLRSILAYWPWLAGLAGYLGFVVGGYWVAEYFFGDEIACKVFRIPDFPIVVTVEAFVLARRGVTWPWRYRRMRLLREAMGFSKETQITQKKVDSWLVDRASRFHRLRREQEAIRHGSLPEGSLPEPQKGAALKRIEADIANAKHFFWKAYALPKKAGFEMKPSILDYT